jgi:mannose-6-phosphate isomerase-like protein (cupin superfamily)
MLGQTAIPYGSISLRPSHEDTALLSQRYLAGARSECEHFIDDDYLNHVVDKPWGRECRVYADAVYDVWELVIVPGGRTSTHCHPRKETALLVLSGQAKVRLLGQTRILDPGDYVHFHPGVFHSTENIGPCALHLIELETPRNKLDLVRASDAYGRTGQRYERATLSSEIAPLVDSSEMPGARIRTTGNAAEYRFSVLANADDFKAPPQRMLFAVSLAVQPTPCGAFDILTQVDSHPPRSIATPYLSVERNSQSQGQYT